MYRGLVCLILGSIVVSAPVVHGDLVGRWEFDEGTGTTVHDSSGNGIDGTIAGQAIWAFGVHEGAIQLDGSSWVDFGTPAKLELGGAMTLSCWVNPASIGGEQSFLAMYHSYAFKASGQQIRFTTPGILDHTSSNVNLQANEWQHAAVSFLPGQAGGVVFYFNGVEASRTTASNLTQGGGPFQIGNNRWNEVYTGLVDDVRVYDRILGAAQIEDVFLDQTISFLKAQNPDPPDGTIGVVAPLLRWTKGETAMFHNVHLGASRDLTEADLKAARQPVTLYYHAAGLLPGTTYYWRVDEIEKDGVTIHTGDVWSFVTQDVTAYYPSPADGSNTVSLTPTLTWMPGMGAIKHQVYFSDSLDAVTQGAAEADKGTLELADTAFAPGVLEPLTTYYWRVDETVGGGAVKAGPVWSFTTALPIDDFESYTDDEGSRIYETWIDGFSTGENGSTVGYFSAPFAEQTIVHEGLQSMPLDYNNVDSPFYSQAEREFAPVQDWTADGIDTLVLHFRGRFGNRAAPLYVALEDAAGQAATVIHADPAAVITTQWTQWRIPLAEFTGVNVARVKKIYIGLGDRQNPAAGGRGVLYIDDIRVTRPAPVE